MPQNPSADLHAARAPRATRTQAVARDKQETKIAASRPRRRSAPPPRATSREPQPGAQESVRIDSPVALLAAVPVLLTFEPDNSMVIIGTEPDAQVRLTLRYDLPDPFDARLANELALHATCVLAAQRVRTAVAVGYGPADRVTPVVDALLEHAPRAGITVTELLRAENQRYWSYLCTEPGCCAPEGTPFDLTDHPVTRAFAAAGATAVLSSRSELAATVAPLVGDAAEAMQRATRKAEEDAARLLSRVARSGRKAAARRLISTAGLRAVATVIGRYRSGDSMDPEVAAWLSVVLRDLRVRDDAWSRMLPEYREAHLRLWTDLTRMAQPGYVPAPASLLAFVAWQSGNGALANVALDRALADDPCYSMARLLREAVESGAPPSLARLPMTPEEVAASYDALEAEAQQEEDGESGEPCGGASRDG